MTSEGRPVLSLCFPAYNEEAAVEGVLRDAHEVATRTSLPFEIVVVDDGSSDGTLPILRRLEGELPGLRVAANERNRGIWYTFERLYREARGEWIFLNSTDGECPSSILLDLVGEMESADIVVASRRDKHYGLGRRVISWTFNAAPRYLFGVQTYDAGALKLMRTDVVRTISVISRSPFSEAERLIRAARLGRRIVNHPMDSRPRATGRSHAVRLGVLASSALDVARLWWDLHRPGRGLR
jgi:glycosyltransferase involved in cell wall biosynthesis